MTHALRFLVLILIAGSQFASAITVEFWRAEHNFRITREGGRVEVEYVESRTSRNQLMPVGVVSAVEVAGYFEVKLENGITLFLPPAVFDERDVSWREKSQNKHSEGRARLADGHEFWLAEEHRSSVEMEHSEEYAELPRDFVINAGAVVTGRPDDLHPKAETGVLAVKGRRGLFTVEMREGRIVDFGYEGVPEFGKHRVINPMEKPPYDRVIELDYNQYSNELVLRTHKVFSVVEPRLNHQRVWYWVVTTTGQVLEIGNHGNAVGVAPGESFEQAIHRMLQEDPDAKLIKEHLNGETESKWDHSLLEKSLDIKKLQKSKIVRVSRIIPAKDCEDALVQSQDEFYK